MVPALLIGYPFSTRLVTGGDGLDDGLMFVQRHRIAALGGQRRAPHQRHGTVNKVQLLHQIAVMRGKVDLVVKAAIGATLREPKRMQALLTMLSLSKSDTAAILDEISVPSLIVMGTKDPDFTDPVEEARSLASRLHAETMIVEGAGHYPHVEMPNDVGQRIIAFVRQLDKSGPAVVPLRRS